MDEHNVHHFWGVSPAVDLLAVAESGGLTSASREEAHGPINILQAGSCDPRHTLTTLARLHRHTKHGSRPLHLYIYEEEPEVLLRHMLLMLVLLDESLLARERMEMFLELHSNALLRDNTVAYLEAKGKTLETLLINLSSGKTKSLPKPTTDTKARAAGVDQLQPALAQITLADQSGGQTVSDHATSSYRATDLLQQLLDISLLKFQDRDRLVEALQHYRTSTQYDMVQAWDARSRKWYQERYDARRNMIDWDYHMPMTQAGTPGQAVDKGSIIHYHHFRHWRLHGVAYELRDQRYNHPNRSLLSTAYGRTKEFKDRNGKDVGRSVSARGYWGDILNGPYHCWGTLCEDEGFYRFSNKQWTRTSMDVAERNVLALLHELRTGSAYPSGEGGEPHRARAARGPTSLADLKEESEKTERARQEHMQQQQGQGQIQGPRKQLAADKTKQLASVAETAEEAATELQGTAQTGEQVVGAGDGSADQGEIACETAGAAARDGVVEEAAAAASGGQQTAAQASDSGSAPASGSKVDGVDEAEFVSSATFQGPRKGYLFKRGPKGIGYYRDTKGGAAVGAGDRQQIQGEAGGSVNKPATEGAEGVVSTADAGAVGDSGADDSGQGPAETAAVVDAVAEQAAALRAAEAVLDAAAARRLLGAGVRIIPVLGGGGSAGAGRGAAGAVSDVAKLLTGREKYRGTFHVLSVGHRHVHLVNPEHKLAQAAHPGALLVVEGAKHLLQLKPEHVTAFAEKVEQMAGVGGWGQAPGEVSKALRTAPTGSAGGMTLTDAHMLFTLKPAQTC